ncbi:MAG: AAA family ATPase [Actinomycetota bacterium]
MEFKVLGPVEVLHEGAKIGLTRDGVSVIALLLMADQRPLSVDEILDGVHEARIESPGGRRGDAERPSKGSLRVLINGMRKAFERAGAGDPIETVDGGYRMPLEGHRYDVTEFLGLLSAARRLAAVAPARSFEAFQGANALVRGAPFSGEPGVDATADYRRDVSIDVLVASHEQIEPAVTIGRGSEFIHDLELLILDDPDDERFPTWLMTALSMAGRYPEAERVFTQYEKHLDTKHAGATPSKEINNLFTAVLRREVPRPVPKPPLPATIVGPSESLAVRDEYIPVETVGRKSLLAELTRADPDPETMSCAYTIMRGEAGIGKSRLAYEAARLAHERGAIVLHGRVEPDLQPPYGPFAEMIRYLLRYTSDLSVNDAVGPGAADLARIVPEFEPPQGVPVPPGDLDPATERFRLLEALVDWLATMSRFHHVVIVIDDIHDASPAVLEALRYIARSPTRMDVAIYATARPVRGRLVTGSHFERHCQTMSRHILDVGGLDVDECSEYVTSVRGELDDRARDVVGQIHALSRGNPFHVANILRSIERRGLAEVTEGRWHVDDDFVGIEVPTDVAETVAERYAGLDESDMDIVTTAAVIGAEFDVPLLIAATGQPASDVGGLIRKLSTEGVVEPVEGVSGHWRFSHDLLRDALIVSASREEQAPFNLRIAEALDRLRGTRPDAPFRSLSFHYYRSLWLGDVDDRLADRARRAIECCEAGVSAATEDRQFSDVAMFHRRHLKILHQWDVWASESVFDTEQEISLLILRGRALREASEPSAVRVLLHACLLAEGKRAPDDVEEIISRLRAGGVRDPVILASRDLEPYPSEVPVRYPELLGEAARANTLGSFSIAGGRLAVLKSAWLQRSLQYADALGDRAVALTETRLSMENLYLERPDTGLARAEKAFSLALTADLEPRDQLRIMSDLLQLLWRPDKMDRRSEIVARMKATADVVGQPHWSWAAHSFGFQIASERGNLLGADEHLGEMVRLAGILKQPRLVQWTKLRQAVREAIRGNLDASEELAVAGWKAARAAGDADADLYIAGQLYTIHFQRDTLRQPPVVAIGAGTAKGATLTHIFEAWFAALPQLPVISAALAATYAQAGDDEKTRHWLEQWDDGGARKVLVHRQDQDQLAAAAALSIGAVSVSDLEKCEILTEILTPHAALYIDNGTSYHGSAAHYLAGLASALGKVEESDELYAYAVEQNRAIESPPYEGMSLMGWSECLADRSPKAALDPFLAASRIAAENPQLACLNRRVAALEPRVLSG